MRGKTVVAAALAGVLMLPAGAAARTYQSSVGDPELPPDTAPAGTLLNTFFPKSIKIRKGDKIRYTSQAFLPHTASVLKPDAGPQPVAIPDPSGAILEGVTDPTGQPFFFNGLPKWIYNPSVWAPIGDRNVNDRQTHSSGAMFPAPGQTGPPRYKLKFSRLGNYRVLCLIHPGMQQKVRVLRKKAKGADRPAQVRRRIATQPRKLYEAARRAAGESVAANTVAVGLERRRATLLVFKPAALTVPVGTTVRFENRSPTEVHQMVFVGSSVGTDKWTATDYADAFTQQQDRVPIGPNAANQFAPAFIYGSEPRAPGAPFVYSGQNYGNGFLWTPVLDDQPGDPPNGLPGEDAITFSTAGTYHYYCGIHGKTMAGDIVVQ
jgi:plastocyanin